MAFTEIDVFGIYVSPYAFILLAAWAFTFVLRVLLTRMDLLLHAWNPALLMFAIFVAVFSSAVLLAAAVS